MITPLDGAPGIYGSAASTCIVTEDPSRPSPLNTCCPWPSSGAATMAGMTAGTFAAARVGSCAVGTLLIDQVSPCGPAATWDVADVDFRLMVASRHAVAESSTDCGATGTHWPCWLC